MLNREPYIDMVIGPQSYHNISDLILNYQRKKEKVNSTEFDVVNKFDKLEKFSNNQNKVSSNLTIQEGCNKFCHFCVVPYTRGPEYSRPFDQIIKEAEYLVSRGTKEIVLLGQNVNAYNFSKNNINYRLSSLIKELNNIENLKRIRFTTSHPKDMTDDLISCYSSCEKLMPLLHLPVQSGSDKILKLMNRKHTIKHYLDIIKKLKNVSEHIKISSDFIIGYPEENEKDFLDTIDLVEKVGFINSYSFIFSPRPGTPASLKQLNDLKENKEKLEKFHKVLKNVQLENNKNYLEKNCEVLVENKLKNKAQYFGRTRYMTPVIFEASNCEIGELADVKVKSFNHNSLFGHFKTNKAKAA